MTQEEFDRVVAIAKEKRHCEDIVFRVSLLIDAVEFERERCAKVAEEFRCDSDITVSYRNAMAQNIATSIRQGKKL
jgi:hypothetical protein